MDIASTLYDGEQLRKINMCRIYLKITFLSDIAAVNGQRILLGYYNGKHHQDSGRRSRLNWPPVGELPQSWWKLWQEFLTRWCGSALRIADPLGRWYEGAEVLTQCCFLLHERRLIMNHQNKYYEFSPVNDKARTRFQTQAYLFDELHLIRVAKVVDITYKNKSIYVIAQSAQTVIPSHTAPESQSLQDLYRDLAPELQRTIGKVTWPNLPELIDIVQSIQTGTAMGVSDGSVRMKADNATHAWIIQASNGSEIRGHGPVDGIIEARTIHRAELHWGPKLPILAAFSLYYRQCRVAI